MDINKTLGIKNLLNSSDRFRLIRLAKRLAKRPFRGVCEWFSEVFFGLNESVDQSF